MEQVTIAALTRDTNGTGAARAARRAGQIPAVIYGRGQEAISLLIDSRELHGFIRHHGSLIQLTIDGKAPEGNLAALLKQTQRDPISREILSVDLVWVSMAEAVEVQVPVTLVGEAPGVTRDGGALDQSMHEITISCLPGDIPESIAVDISALGIGDTLHVSSITPPEKITIVTAGEDPVVTIMRPIRAEDLEAHLEEGETVAAEGEGQEAGGTQAGAQDEAGE